MVKPLTQKDSVEISLESINNSDIAKSNAREEETIATDTIKINKDKCDTQNNNIVDHTKKDAKNVNGNQLLLTIICQKTQDKEAIASFIRVPTMQVIIELIKNNKNFTSS